MGIMGYLNTNGHNKSLPELTHFVLSDELNSGPERCLLDCISVSKDNRLTRFTPSDGLKMFWLWCMYLRLRCMRL